MCIYTFTHVYANFYILNTVHREAVLEAPAKKYTVHTDVKT